MCKPQRTTQDQRQDELPMSNDVPQVNFSANAFYHRALCYSPPFLLLLRLCLLVMEMLTLMRLPSCLYARAFGTKGPIALCGLIARLWAFGGQHAYWAYTSRGR
jgi:hypothetical protein